MARARAVVALGAALLAAGCSRTAPDPVRALLAELEEAAEARDTDRFLARVSDAFSGQDGQTRAEVQAELRRYFAAYESIALDLYEVESERREGAARIRLKVAFSGQARRAFGLEGLLPPAALYRFDLEAGDEGGTWRVTRGSWERVEARPET